MTSGFETDRDDPDLLVDGVGLEVMTAQVEHRKVTGFCVPPNKLWAHQQRGVRGYVFVGTGPEKEPRQVVIQAICRIESVDVEPARPTKTWSGGTPVENYVVPDELLMPPEEIAQLLNG